MPEQLPFAARFDRFARASFIELVAQGHSRTGAAKRLGFARKTITSRMRHDPDFAAAVLEAEGEVLDEIEAVVYDRARKGHVEAAKFVLERRDPMRWGPLSARVAIVAQPEPTAEELSETAVSLIRQIIDKESRAAEGDADADEDIIDAESVEVVPPVPAALPGQSDLADVDWDTALGDSVQ